MAAKKIAQQPLHELLREARVALGLSQEMLASQIGTNQSTVSGWERDETCPDLPMLATLAGVLAVPRDALVDAALDYAARYEAGRTNRRGS